MKQAITIPSVVPGRRVRWIFELSAERQEVPLPMSPVALAPQTPTRLEVVPAARPAPASTPSLEGVTPSLIVMRRGTPAFRLLLTGVAIVGFVVAFAVGRRLAADEEYVVATPFESQVAADRDPTVAPVASTPATPPAPTVATPPVAAIEPPTNRPVAATPAATEPPSTPSRKTPKAMTVSAPAPTIVEKPVVKPVVEAHATETPAPAATAAVASAVATSPSPVAADAAAAVEEVTITGCLEISKDDDRFRLSDTEGANAPQARSWRSGFFKKRSAAVDLVASKEALSLSRQVGHRVAATGVLSSRTLTVSSVRVVSSSCN